MSTPTTTRSALGAVAGAPFDTQTYRNLAYILLALPLGFTAFLLLVVGTSLSIGLLVTLLGPVVFLCVLLVAMGLAWVDLRLTDHLLGVTLAGPSLPADTEGPVDYVLTLATSRDAWLSAVYCGWRALFGFVAFVFLSVGVGMAVGLLAAPLVYGGALVVDYQVGVWTVDTLSKSLLAACVGLVVAFLTLLGSNLLAAASREVAVLAFGAGSGTEPDVESESKPAS